MKPQNLHTHTTYCDGQNTPAEMARAAFAQGCGSLGFSGHAFLDFDPVWNMSIGDTEKYRQDVLALRREYEGRMEIWLGLEQDYYSEPPEPGQWDYIIGSVHCLKKGGAWVSVDNTRAGLESAISQLYGGDGLAFAEDYYRLIPQLPARTGCQIIGHLDLVTKFNEDGTLFDMHHPRYVEAALEAVRQLVGQDVIFEINSGAISRGYRTAPYPADFLLRAICSAGGRICFSSDTHNKDTLLFGYRDSVQLARTCGFTEAWVLTGAGFRPVALSELI